MCMNSFKPLKVYGIGGLGVDESVFSELNLHFDLIPLKWIAANKNESIRSYAKRFAKQIDRTERFAIIGVSFGGMLAIELNTLLTPDSITLISSATSKADIPFIFRLLGKAGVMHLIPDVLLKPPSFVANFFFGVQATHHKAILKQILKETNTDFLRWAINQLVKWDNSEVHDNMMRVHGSSDRMLRYPQKERIHVIPKAGHFMVVTEAEEVSTFLNRVYTGHS